MGSSMDLAQSAAAMISMVLVVLCILIYCLWDACAACWRRRRRLLHGPADSDSDSESVFVALAADGPRLVTRRELVQLAAAAAKRRSPPPPAYSPPRRRSPPPPYESTTGGDSSEVMLVTECPDSWGSAHRVSEPPPPEYATAVLEDAGAAGRLAPSSDGGGSPQAQQSDTQAETEGTRTPSEQTRPTCADNPKSSDEESGLSEDPSRQERESVALRDNDEVMDRTARGPIAITLHLWPLDRTYSRRAPACSCHCGQRHLEDGL